jgi:hypothetical protein
MNPLSELIHEDAVYERFPGVFATRELREARQRGLIKWYDLRKGPHYTEAQLMAYVQTKERSGCDNAKLDPEKKSPPVSGKSVPSGLPSKKPPRSFSIVDMTPDLERYAADQLENET